MQQLQFDADELNLLLRYAVNVMNLSSQWAATTQLNESAMGMQLSLRLSQGPLPLFLNVEANLLEQDKQLKLQALKIGRIRIPDRFLQFTLQRFSGAPGCWQSRLHGFHRTNKQCKER